MQLHHKAALECNQYLKPLSLEMQCVHAINLTNLCFVGPAYVKEKCLKKIHLFTSLV